VLADGVRLKYNKTGDSGIGHSVIEEVDDEDAGRDGDDAACEVHALPVEHGRVRREVRHRAQAQGRQRRRETGCQRGRHVQDKDERASVRVAAQQMQQCGIVTQSVPKHSQHVGARKVGGNRAEVLQRA
jgi:hypothetical protein